MGTEEARPRGNRSRQTTSDETGAVIDSARLGVKLSRSDN